MFCDGCGSPVQAGQRFCSKCGKQILGPVAAMPGRPGRVQRHLKLLSVLWLGLASLTTVAGVGVYIAANVVIPHLKPDEVPIAFLHPLLNVIAIVLLAMAAILFIGGWGLLHRERWARTVILVMSFIALFVHVPFGTALGIYTMWVLLPNESEQEYETLAEARAAA